ncbi:MAG: phosphoglyceromutase, partial [uncultured bacterium]
RGDKTDYYIQPIMLAKEGTIKTDDSVIFWNFRTDRAKQLTELLAKEKIALTIFGDYSKKADIAFHSTEVKNNLGETLSKNKIHQLRIAETEKYAHVTFFFNSQVKDPYPLEARVMIPSPKVPSYAQKPEMSAHAVTTRVIKEISREKYGFIALNYANADLVGHSGELKPTIECCKHLDKCLSEVVPQALKHGYDIILTADHGNADTMLAKDNSPNPAHSFNPVLCTIISNKPELKKLRLKKERGLSVIGPTVLKMLGVEKPKEMGEGIY